MNTKPTTALPLSSWSFVQEYLKPILPLLELDGTSEVMVNSWDTIFYEHRGLISKSDLSFPNEQAVDRAIHMIATATGQSCDPINHPIVDARLADGSRVCATLFPVAHPSSNICIRIFPKTSLTADHLLNGGSFNQPMLDYLRRAVAVRCNMLVSGSTSSGKTTLLNILSSFIPDDHRVITVEDTQELNLTCPNWVSLVCPNKPQDDRDAQTINMPTLIKTALRQNPDRIIVGEIRDAAAADALLQAINTGHNGCASTLHANSPRDALFRLQNFIGSTGFPIDYVQSQVRGNLHVLIQAEKVPGVGRLITSITELLDGTIQELFSFDYHTRTHIQHPVDKTLVNTLSTRYNIN